MKINRKKVLTTGGLFSNIRNTQRGKHSPKRVRESLVI